jgi:hypothetical protein
MKLSDLFSYVAHNTTSCKDRNYKYDMLRYLINNRRDFAIENDITELKRHHNRIVKELSLIFPKSDVEANLRDFASYPEVRQHLVEVDSEDEDEVTDDDETMSEPSDEEESEDEASDNDGGEADGDDEEDDEDDFLLEGMPVVKYNPMLSVNYTLFRDSFMVSLMVCNVVLTTVALTKLFSAS